MPQFSDIPRCCATCGLGNPRYDTRDVEVTVGAKTTVVSNITGWFCQKCGEIEFDPTTDSQARWAAAGDQAVLAKREGTQAGLTARVKDLERQLIKESHEKAEWKLKAITMERRLSMSNALGNEAREQLARAVGTARDPVLGVLGGLAPVVPEFLSTGKAKLQILLDRGYKITGYAIEKPAEALAPVSRGFINYGGFVGWWHEVFALKPYGSGPTANKSPE